MNEQVTRELLAEASLFLLDLSEPRDNDLVVQVAPSQTGEAIMTKLGLARPVTPNEGAGVYQFYWSRYVAYAVNNESFYLPPPDDIQKPGLFQTYERSPFLDYVRGASFASDDFPSGPLRHYCLVCESHVIDVVSGDPPEVTRAGGPEAL